MAIPPTLPGGYQLWHYYPSVPGAAVMAVVFLCLTAAHLWFLVRSDKRFCIPLIVGGVCKILRAHHFGPKKLTLAIQLRLLVTVHASGRITSPYR